MPKESWRAARHGGSACVEREAAAMNASGNRDVIKGRLPTRGQAIPGKVVAVVEIHLCYRLQAIQSDLIIPVCAK